MGLLKSFCFCIDTLNLFDILQTKGGLELENIRKLLNLSTMKSKDFYILLIFTVVICLTLLCVFWPFNNIANQELMVSWFLITAMPVVLFNLFISIGKPYGKEEVGRGRLYLWFRLSLFFLIGVLVCDVLLRPIDLWDSLPICAVLFGGFSMFAYAILENYPSVVEVLMDGR